MSMSNGFYFAAPLLLLTACSTVNTRTDQTDALAFDASAIDTPRDDVTDAHRDPDAFSDASISEPDAWLPDAFTPDAYIEETCDGRDEDGDFTVDEGAVCAGFCLLGRCECPAGTDDCTDAPGCETWMNSSANCGGCGIACGIAEHCDVEAGPAQCRPTPIFDFTAAFEDSGITCIVRPDNVVLCRGPNTDYAISNDYPEDAVLDWTDMRIRASKVFSWGHLRGDGVRTMTICTQGTTSGAIHCRGSNTTGLVFGRADEPDPGWHLIPTPGTGLNSIEGGEGVGGANSGFGFVWGGAHAAGRVRSLRHRGMLGDGSTRFIASGELFGWGEPSPILLLDGWVDEGGETLNMVTVPVPEVPPRWGRMIGCYDNYCCLLGAELLCWGGTVPHQPRERIELPGASLFLSPPRVFPTPSGVSVCVSNEAWESYCMPLSGIHDGPAGRVLTLDPVARARGGATRADWRADCRDTGNRSFRCHGMHSGWP